VSFSASEDAATVDSVQLLRRKLNASRTLSKSLTEEQNRNAAIIQQLRVLESETSERSLSFLTKSTGAQNLNVTADSRSLTTNTTFTMSQLPALKALLAEIRPRLASLPAVGTTIGSARDEIRQERREYIEQRTKAHLERNGGMMTDGASALPNTPLDRQEIQALEKVAQIFNPS
jgi:kinetochore protein Mis12/MTW1